MKLPIIPRDKANHFVYGVAIFVVIAALINPQSGLVIVVLAGALKEAHDATGRGNVEINDFLFTVAGGGIGYVCTLL
jgi:hypothetical protein